MVQEGAASVPALVIQAARERVASVCHALEEARARGSYPCRGSHSLLGRLEHIATTTRRRLDQLAQLPEYPAEQALHLAAGLGDVALRVHQLLEFVAHSEWQEIPYVWAVPLENLLRKAAPEAQPLLSSWWSYNYFLTSISPALTEVETALGIAPKAAPLPVLGVPHAEKDNPLLHAILFHEVGHLMIEESGLALPLTEPNEAELQALAEQSSPSPEPRPGPSLLQYAQGQALRYEFDQRSRAWAEELLADLIALGMVGPAYFFAFAMLSTGGEAFSEPDRDQPPRAIRFRALGLALEKWRYLEVLPEPLRLVVTEWRAHGDALREAGLSPLHEFVLRRLEEKVDELVPLAGRATPGLAYPAETYAQEVEPLRERLLAGVPPDTIADMPYRPASLPGILNAGWEVRLAFLDSLQQLTVGREFDPRNADQRSEALAVLNRLTTKAIEYHSIATQWEAARASLER